MAVVLSSLSSSSLSFSLSETILSRLLSCDLIKSTLGTLPEIDPVISFIELTAQETALPIDLNKFRPPLLQAPPPLVSSGRRFFSLSATCPAETMAVIADV